MAFLPHKCCFVDKVDLHYCGAKCGNGVIKQTIFNEIETEIDLPGKTA